MNWTNNVTTACNTSYPFIQAPMLGITTPEMVAAVSNMGALGSLPLGLTGATRAAELIKAVKSKTGKSFGVNLFVYPEPVIGTAVPPTVIPRFYENAELRFPKELPSKDPSPLYTELIEVIIAEKIKVVSFTFGLPNADTIMRLKASGATLVATATCVREAVMAEESGFDMVVAQGIEAGGHRGALSDEAVPQIGLMALLPQVVEKVKIPVIAAGAIMQGRSAAAAFILGAQGVQVGSAFLQSDESAASDIYKEAVAKATDESCVLTKAWTGKYARGINNEFISSMEQHKNEILPYPLQHYLTAELRSFGRRQNIADLQSLWAGQACSKSRRATSGAIMEGLVHEAEGFLSALQLWQNN